MRAPASSLPASRLVGALAVAAVDLAACGTGTPAGMPDLGALAAAPDLDPGPRSTLGDDAADAARRACTYHRGDLPNQTLAADVPLGAQIPIDTVVIIMMENRAFDSLLGNLKATQPDADMAPLDATNPDAMGNPIARFHQTDLCFEDTAHGWNSVHQEYDGGKMDGFVLANAKGTTDAVGRRAMGYYTEAEIPYLYALASTFAIGDRYHCDVLGSTQPNRDYLYAATSYGRASNDIFLDKRDNVMELYNAHGVDWHDYSVSRQPLGIFTISYTANLDHFSKMPDFYDAAKAGRLSSVNYVDPDLSDSAGGNQNDFHPEGDLQHGQKFVADVVNALIASPQWPHMAIFLTFDEHGGQYDHVAPPAACPPDDIQPDLSPPDPTAHYDRYGVRVPFLVISPYARPHYVSHRLYSHASIVRFVGARFLLPALTARDANSDVPMDLFDFRAPPRLLHPPVLPDAVEDAAQAATCAKSFPPTP